MVNQSDFQRLTSAFQPFAAMLGKMPDDAAMGVYAEVLNGFPDDVLRGGIKSLLQTYTHASFPKPAHFVAACKEFRDAEADSAPRHSTWLEQRQAEDEAITREAWAYADRFMTSTLGVQAIHDGWDYELKLYIVAAASYIAQKLHGRQNCGVDTQALCGHHWGNTSDCDHTMRNFYAMARRSIAAGRIHVEGVPSEFIDRWRFTAERKQSQNQKKAA